jgi:hypothetical protein
MRCPSPRFVRPVLVPLFFVAGIGAAIAADVAPLPPAPIVEPPVALPPVWSFRFTPYGWLTSMKGTQTVRGRSTKVDASFIDIVEKSDTLVGLMGTFEARNGPFALYGDLVWSKVGIEGGNVRTRTPAPGITGTVGRAAELDFQMAIVEVGAAYEVARSGPLAFDVLGGARYCTRRRISRWRSPAPSTSVTWSSPEHAPSRGPVPSTGSTL